MIVRERVGGARRLRKLPGAPISGNSDEPLLCGAIFRATHGLIERELRRPMVRGGTRNGGAMDLGLLLLCLAVMFGHGAQKLLGWCAGLGTARALATGVSRYRWR